MLLECFYFSLNNPTNIYVVVVCQGGRKTVTSEKRRKIKFPKQRGNHS